MTGDLKYTSNLSDRQMAAWEALDDASVKRVLYGGAKGGGKSVFGCRYMLVYALRVIEDFGLKRQRFPIPLGFMGRQVGRDFRTTTLETWKREVPGRFYTIREHNSEIIILGAVKYDYGGLDRSDAVNKFNSAEYGILFIDQAEEVTRDDIGVLRGALRRTIDGRPVPYKEIYTANPRVCWLKKEFIEAPAPDSRFIRALPADNPWLPPGYVEQLRDAFSHRPDLVRAYVEGDWDAMSEFDQIFLERWIQAAEHIQLLQGSVKQLLTCDPARFGDDETAIYQMENTRIVDAVFFGQKPTTYTSSKLAIMSRAANDCTVVVDGVGVGGGVADELRELGVPVIEVNGAEKAYDAKRYGNARAEIWDTAARMMADGDVEIEDPLEPILRGQLIAPRYRFTRGKMYVEEKDDIKARMNNRSPDRADAYVQGLWALQLVPEDEAPERDHFVRRRMRASSRSAMAM